MKQAQTSPMQYLELTIPVRDGELTGELVIPENAHGLVLFSHGSGSSRFSSRNKFVASVLQEHQIGTFLFDLLTFQEEQIYEYRFDIDFLTDRLLEVTNHIRKQPLCSNLKLGYFGASTGAASALRAAFRCPDLIKAVVSRGGRPDLAGPEISLVMAPTLLIVGSEDEGVIVLNQKAYRELTCTRKLEVVEGATHLFEEPGTLDKVASLAADWFTKYL